LCLQQQIVLYYKYTMRQFRPISNEPVVQALALLAQNRSTWELSLEQVIMCAHGKPVEVHTTGWDSRFKHGSILVYADRVVMINDPVPVNPGKKRVRYVGPQRDFGVLPGSRICTKETYIYVLADGQRVQQLRATASKEPVELTTECPEFFVPYSAEQFNVPRCPEELILWGRLDAEGLQATRPAE
jgi:hypothetical protein